MKTPVILVVEDNPLTRNVVKDILQSGGYAVLEAPDGRTALELAASRDPDLILQDMALPDMEGLELCRRLRALPGGERPILALSGLPAELQKAQADGEREGAGFTDFLTKPISASGLLLAVQAHVSAGAAAEEEGEEAAGRRRVLVVEIPEALDSLGFHLEQAGFEPVLSVDPADALADARRAPPEAVVAGILLEGMDGFRLCHAVRTDPVLAAVPVVLVTTTFTAEEDREYARRLGASALVERTARLGEVSAALRAALAGPPPSPAATQEDLGPGHARRILAALHRQARRRADLDRRLAFQSAALSLLGVLSESLSSPRQVARAPDEVLARCLAAAGTSQGAAFLRTGRGDLVLSAQIGFGEGAAGSLPGFFGHGDLLRRALEEREPLVVPSDRVDDAVARDLLGRLGTRSVLLTPLFLGTEGLGVLVMLSGRFDLIDWVDLSRAVSFQISQAISLGRMVSRLAASERRYRSLFESTVYGIYRTSPDGVLVEVNPALAAMLGHDSPGDLLGKPVASLYRRPGDRERLLARYGRVSSFEGVEVEWTRKDGSPVTVRLAGRPVPGEDGGEGGYEVFVEDVTHRREMEERLRQAQRLEAVRRLAGGIAHDFNNLLTAIAGRADLLQRSLEGKERLLAHAAAIDEAVERAGAITKELLAFSRTPALAPREVDLGDLVEEALPMLRRLAGEAVSVEARRAPGPARVFADPGQVEHALINLAVRAREAMPEGGTLLLETAVVVLDAAFARRNPGIPPGSYVLLSVRDDGPEMDEEAREHVFDPVLRGAAEGGGLGMATVHGIVRQSGGHILVRSGEGRGTTFRIYLPRHDVAGTGAGEEREAAASAAPRPGAAGPPTVLLAEDEESVRSLVAETLAMDGYTVIQASDGEAALAAAAGHRGAIDLLITDVVMPRMNGRALAARLAKERPGMRVLFVSGYAERPADEGEVAFGGAPFLQKPFTPRILAARVREVLGQPPAGEGAA